MVLELENELIKEQKEEMSGGILQDSQEEERTGVQGDQIEGCGSNAGPEDGVIRVWN